MKLAKATDRRAKTPTTLKATGLDDTRLTILNATIRPIRGVGIGSWIEVVSSGSHRLVHAVRVEHGRSAMLLSHRHAGHGTGQTVHVHVVHAVAVTVVLIVEGGVLRHGRSDGTRRWHIHRSRSHGRAKRRGARMESGTHRSKGATIILEASGELAAVAVGDVAGNTTGAGIVIVQVLLGVGARIAIHAIEAVTAVDAVGTVDTIHAVHAIDSVETVDVAILESGHIVRRERLLQPRHAVAVLRGAGLVAWALLGTVGKVELDRAAVVCRRLGRRRLDGSICPTDVILVDLRILAQSVGRKRLLRMAVTEARPAVALSLGIRTGRLRHGQIKGRGGSRKSRTVSIAIAVLTN